MQTTLKRWCVVGILVVAGSAGAASAQVPATPGAPPAVSPASPEFVLERKHLRVKYEKDGTGERSLTLRVKVLSEAAVREWGHLPLTYVPNSEELQIARVQVEKPDGTLTADAAGDVQDVAIRPPGDPSVVLDLRQKQIAVATLRPGDILQIEATWKVTAPMARGQYWFEYDFTDSPAVLDERLEIDVPNDPLPILRIRTGSPAEAAGGAGQLQQGRRVYRWTLKNASPRSPEQEAALRRGEEPRADVRLTSYQSWDVLARWFDGLMTVPASAEVQAKAVALTKDVSDPAKKVEAIYDFVAKEIRYLSLSLGVGRFAPHPPEQILKNRYGDCKDKAALLSAMLTAVGIESRPVLLHSNRSLDDDIASPLELDHVITVVPRGNDLAAWTWLDPTTEIAPVGMLARSIRGKRALLVGRGQYATRLVTTPADPPTPWVDRVDVEGKIDAIGALTALATFTFTADSDLMLRGVLRAIPSESIKEVVREVARAYGISGEFSEETASDLSATRQPLELKVKVRKSGVLNWAAATSDMATWPRPVIPFRTAEERPSGVALEFGSPVRRIMRASFELPPGYEMEAPVNVKAGNGPTYLSRYSLDGPRLVIERELGIAVRSIEASRLGEYAALVNAIEADLAQTVKVRAISVATPALPTTATAAELYSAAFNAYKAKNLDAAIAMWTKATELNPKMGDAWNALGIALDDQKQYDKAIASYLKVLELDPYDKRTHRDLGRTYEHAGRLDDAAASFLKHLEINPVDSAALRELGEVYINLRRYEEAATNLGKAAAAGKFDAWGYAILGEALIRSKEQEKQKASAAFERAIELSPAPNIWAKVSWILADTGVDPDWARTLALQAEKHAATTLQNLGIASVNGNSRDLMVRLAWAWDALGMLAMRKGQLDDAERYTRAAWMLGRDSIMAFHLGRIYEQRQQTSDATNYYLTAYVMSRRPSTALKDAVNRLVPATDPRRQAILDATRGFALSMITLPDKGPVGRARFDVIVAADRRVVDLKFRDGDEALKVLDKSLRDVRPPVDLPSGPVTRVAITLYAACDPEHGCAVSAMNPTSVAAAAAR